MSHWVQCSTQKENIVRNATSPEHSNFNNITESFGWHARFICSYSCIHLFIFNKNGFISQKDLSFLIAFSNIRIFQENSQPLAFIMVFHSYSCYSLVKQSLIYVTFSYANCYCFITQIHQRPEAESLLYAWNYWMFFVSLCSNHIMFKCVNFYKWQ